MTRSASTLPPLPPLATAAERGRGSCSPRRPSLLELDVTRPDDLGELIEITQDLGAMIVRGG